MLPVRLSPCSPGSWDSSFLFRWQCLEGVGLLCVLYLNWMLGVKVSFKHWHNLEVPWKRLLMSRLGWSTAHASEGLFLIWLTDLERHALKVGPLEQKDTFSVGGTIAWTACGGERQLNTSMHGCVHSLAVTLDLINCLKFLMPGLLHSDGPVKSNRPFLPKGALVIVFYHRDRKETGVDRFTL